MMIDGIAYLARTRKGGRYVYDLIAKTRVAAEDASNDLDDNDSREVLVLTYLSYYLGTSGFVALGVFAGLETVE